MYSPPRSTEWPLATLGFVEVSSGNYAEAFTIMEPLVSQIDTIPIGGNRCRPHSSQKRSRRWWPWDGSMTRSLMVHALERSGSRLDQAWTLAVGARCRSMVLAAKGDLEAAVTMAQRAMAEHDRRPMPFERARTQLLLGQLQRRQRQKHSAAASLGASVERLRDHGHTPRRAERARAELARTNVSPGHEGELTPSELRVAELAASGMTNRDVAAELFISTKTVEANLTQIYRKLGIHSRAELGAVMGSGRAG